MVRSGFKRLKGRYASGRDSPLDEEISTVTTSTGPVQAGRRHRPRFLGSLVRPGRHQVGWKQYLDDVANAGYVWTELGPQGFLPQDPQQLRDELDQRGLKVCGGTVFAGLHKGKDALEKAIADFSQEAKLLTEVGAKYLIHLPEQYTDMHTGDAPESGDIDPEQWKNLITGTNELGRIIFEEYGVELVFHPHADTHVDTQERILQFLADTDPSTSTSAWTPATWPTATATTWRSSRRLPERITYVHLKFVDPKVRQRVRDEKLSLAEAVPLGVMVEPPYGEPAVPPLLDALSALDREIFTVLEQDLYPVAPEYPLGIQARAAGYLTGCGLGPIRRWPY